MWNDKDEKSDEEDIGENSKGEKHRAWNCESKGKKEQEIYYKKWDNPPTADSLFWTMLGIKTKETGKLRPHDKKH